MLAFDDLLQRPLNVLSGFFGSVNDRKIKAKAPMVARINALEAEFEAKSNEELKALSVKVRPVFVAHLEHAKQLQSKMGKG